MYVVTLVPVLHVNQSYGLITATKKLIIGILSTYIAYERKQLD